MTRLPHFCFTHTFYSVEIQSLVPFRLHASVSCLLKSSQIMNVFIKTIMICAVKRKSYCYNAFLFLMYLSAEKASRIALTKRMHFAHIIFVSFNATLSLNIQVEICHVCQNIHILNKKI